MTFKSTPFRDVHARYRKIKKSDSTLLSFCCISWRGFSWRCLGSCWRWASISRHLTKFHLCLFFRLTKFHLCLFFRLPKFHLCLFFRFPWLFFALVLFVTFPLFFLLIVILAVFSFLSRLSFAFPLATFALRWFSSRPVS